MIRKPGIYTAVLALAIMLVSAWIVREERPSAERIKSLATAYDFVRHPIPSSGQSKAELFAKELAPFERFVRAFLPIASTFFQINGHQFLCVADPISDSLEILAVGSDAYWTRQNVRIEEILPTSNKAIPTACLQGDWNRDGRTDLVVGFWGRSPVLLTAQDETTKEQYVFSAEELLDSVEPWYTQSIASADVDGDGTIDLVFANYFDTKAKVLASGPGHEARMNNAWSRSDNGGANRIFLGVKADSGPRFADVSSVLSKYPKRWTIAIGLADMDDDLLPELVFLNDHGPDLVLHNRSVPGRPQFEMIVNPSKMGTPKSHVIGRDDFHGMGVDFADINRDGHLDWAVSNFGADFVFHQTHFVWIHSGNNESFAENLAPYTNQSEDLGLARTREIPWDLRIADFNNDGLVELFQSIGFVRGELDWTPIAHEQALHNDNLVEMPLFWHSLPPEYGWAGNGPNAFYSLTDEGRYVDIGSALGFMEPGVSRGIATTDINHDGLIDYFVGNHDAEDSLYVNQSPGRNQFLSLDIDMLYGAERPGEIRIVPLSDPLTLPTRDAVGARVTFHLQEGSKVVEVIDGGSGFSGKKHRFAHVGLGQDAPATIQVQIDWRDDGGNSHSQTIKLAPGRHRLVLGESDGLANMGILHGEESGIR